MMLPLLLAVMQTAEPAPDTETIIARMMQADEARRATLERYTGMRRYRVENRRFNKRAEMLVRCRFSRPGTKEFEIVSESGSAAVRKMALRRMVETEREVSRHEDQRRDTQISPANYDFQYLRTEMLDGRPTFVLRATPKTQNPLLFRGAVWVDAEDYAVVRIEGSPAKKPSFWIRQVTFVHRYQKFGPYWLPVLNESKSDVRIFGHTDTVIEYFDYRINSPEEGEALAQPRQTQ